MPTAAIAPPKAPSEARVPSEAVAFGKAQWTRKWKVFASQWTQPQLMKLAKETLGEAAIHSSQIHGFTTGKLRDPAPKVLLAIGQLNLALAAANGGSLRTDLPPHHPKCPGVHSDLWQGKHWMQDPEGYAMGPQEVFEVITGMVDLHSDEPMIVHDGNVEAVCQSIGKFMRVKLSEQGIDWFEIYCEGDDDVMHQLIRGKLLPPQEVMDHKEQICEICKCTMDELLEHAVLPNLQ